MLTKHKVLVGLSALALMNATGAFAGTAITVLNANQNSAIPVTKITQIIRHYFNVDQYRQVKAQVIFDDKNRPDHILVYLFAKKYHRVDISRINIDSYYVNLSVINNYRLSAQDFLQQPGVRPEHAKCPDNSIEFIAFAPNDIDVEQQVTIDVANAAEAHALKTIRLLKGDATRTNYLNYLKCPKLKGNFYDGDANPEVITTVDGVISFEDINQKLKHRFKYKVTNIWLACEAYNDPLKTSLLDTAQSQKYAAGINDLLVGPSDDAAACAMKAGIDGKPMTSSFDLCYKEYDDPEDQWGFGGYGSDIFGA